MLVFRYKPKNFLKNFLNLMWYLIKIFFLVVFIIALCFIFPWVNNAFVNNNYEAGIIVFIITSILIFLICFLLFYACKYEYKRIEKLSKSEPDDNEINLLRFIK
jgi:NADH:ubiquinone oxidoreductase subunit 3 (subunit A)